MLMGVLLLPCALARSSRSIKQKRTCMALSRREMGTAELSEPLVVPIPSEASYAFLRDFAFHMQARPQPRRRSFWIHHILLHLGLFPPKTPERALAPASFANLAVPGPQLAAYPVSCYPTSAL